VPERDLTEQQLLKLHHGMTLGWDSIPAKPKNHGFVEVRRAAFCL
jgi:hypothetical protein